MGVKAGKNVECDADGQWWYFNGRNRVRTIPRTCERCGEAFVPAANAAVAVRFCGHRCAMLAHHAKRPQVVAGKGSIPSDVYVKTPEKFELDAGGQWWYLSGKGRFRTSIIVCAKCGRKFLAAHGGNSQRAEYCSRKCGVLAAYSRTPGAERSYKSARAYQGGRLLSKGYVFVLVPMGHPGVQGTTKRYLPEHRMVMEQVLGRRLTKHERVHHKNGIRDDNRPENLELWQSAHPYGQRSGEQQHCPTCTCFKSH